MESQKLYMASISMETISHCHGKSVHFEKKIGPFGKSVRNEAAEKTKYRVDCFLWQEEQIQMSARISEEQG